jgi:hypothetical protein
MGCTLRSHASINDTCICRLLTSLSRTGECEPVTGASAPRHRLESGNKDLEQREIMMAPVPDHLLASSWIRSLHVVRALGTSPAWGPCRLPTLKLLTCGALPSCRVLQNFKRARESPFKVIQCDSYEGVT